jgi:hypothetical protein
MVRKTPVERVREYNTVHIENLDENEKNAQRQFYKRLRKSKQGEIEKLTELMKELPESEFEKIFTNDAILPFIRELFKIKIKAEGHDEWKSAKEKRLMWRKRARLLELSKAILRLINDHEFLRDVLGDASQPHISSDPRSIENYRVLMYGSI